MSAGRGRGRAAGATQARGTREGQVLAEVLKAKCKTEIRHGVSLRERAYKRGSAAPWADSLGLASCGETRVSVLPSQAVGAPESGIPGPSDPHTAGVVHAWCGVSCTWPL